MDNRILIIGNGFDIAHGLPTRYGDFIEFLAAFESLYDTYALKNQKLTDEEFNSIKTEKLNFKLTKMLHALFVCGRYVYHPNGMLSVDDPILSRLYDVINSNAWFEYFYALYEKKKMKGLNWIDFEAEMSEIIRWIDGTSLQLDDDFDIVVDTLFGNATDEKKTQFQGMIASHCGANYYEELIDELYSELEKLIEALDIYLSAFVETLPIDKKSIISAIDPEFVISFNYTHTFSKLYNQQIPICYIHGETGHPPDRRREGRLHSQSADELRCSL